MAQIEHGCDAQKPLGVHEDEWEKHHGRLERRTYELFSALPMLAKWQNDWSDIVQIIRVTRQREAIGYGAVSEDVSYYVMNRSLPLTLAHTAIRRHWFIENKLHYVKDVAYHEDLATRRVNPCIFSTCIDFALNRLRIDNCDNIKGQLYENSLLLDKAIKYFKQ